MQGRDAKQSGRCQMKFFAIVVIMATSGPYTVVWEVPNMKECVKLALKAERVYERHFQLPVDVNCIKERSDENPYSQRPVSGHND